MIKQVVKSPEGEYEFSANVTQEEFDFIFGCGVNFLLQSGAIAVNGEEEEDEEDNPEQYKMDMN